MNGVFESLKFDSKVLIIFSHLPSSTQESFHLLHSFETDPTSSTRPATSDSYLALEPRFSLVDL